MKYRQAYMWLGCIGTRRARTITDIKPGDNEVKEAIGRTTGAIHLYTNYIDCTSDEDGDDDEEKEVLCAPNTLHLNQHFMDYTDTESTKGKQQDKQAMDYIITATDNTTKTNSSITSCLFLSPMPFAATSATEKEEEIAKKGRHPDGSKVVQVPKIIWCPKVRMIYEEPEELLDTNGDLDWIFEEHGKVMTEDKRKHYLREMTSSTTTWKNI
jgi:hypothetical protein